MKKFLFSENRMIWQGGPEATAMMMPDKEPGQGDTETPEKPEEKPSTLTEQQERIVKDTKPELITVRSEVEARETFYKTIIPVVPESLKAGFEEYFRKNVYVPGKGWEKQREEWLKAVAEKIEDAKNLDEVFGANGSPGPFEKWLKEKYPQMMGMWEEREKMRGEKVKIKVELAGEMTEEKEWLDKNLALDGSLQTPEFEGLREKAKEIAGELEFPIEKEKTGGVEGVKAKVANLKLAVADAMDLKEKLDQIATKASLLPLLLEKGKTQISQEVEEIKGEIKKAVDADGIAKLKDDADQLSDKNEKWAQIVKLAEDKELSGNLETVLSQEENPDTIIARLNGIKERLAQERSIASGEPGWGDDLIGFINQYVTDSSKKKMIYGIIAGIAGLLSAIPFFGKGLRRKFISNSALAYTAEQTGKTNLLNEANTEINTTKICRRAEIKKESIPDILDMKVSAFYSANPTSLTKDPTEVPAFERLKIWMRNNNLPQDDKRTLAVAIGSMGGNFKVEVIEPSKPEEKPQEAPKRPEELLTEFYDKEPKLTPDKITTLENLSAKKLASGEIKLEDQIKGIPENKAKRILALLEKYKAKDEADPEKKFKDFLVAAVTKDPKSITEV